MNAIDIIRHLELEKLPHEGGYFRQTFRSQAGGNSPWGTAIYYLVTPDEFSALHRLPSEEMFHFYGGDPVEMFQITSDGQGQTLELGMDLARGQRPQVLIPAGVWQGTRLKPGGQWALFGCTVIPGFEVDTYEGGERAALIREFPQHAEWIEALTR